MKPNTKNKSLSSKSFFDLSEEEQKEILDQAADDANKAQQELMEQTEEQVCTDHLDCGVCMKAPSLCSAHQHTPLLDTEALKKDFIKNHNDYKKYPKIEDEDWDTEA